MKVLEHFVRGKWADPRRCEDAIVVTDDFVFVIDGTTDKYDGPPGGASPGRRAAEALVAAVRLLPSDVSLRRCVDELSEVLQALAMERTSAMMVAYSSARREVWRVGDGSWLAGSVGSIGRKQVDVVVANARAALLRALIAAGNASETLQATDPGRAMMLPLLRMQHHLANDSDTCLAYGVLDGRPVPGRFLECWEVEANTDVVLASDGYPALFATLAETEANLAVELRRDPLRIERHPATKGMMDGQVSFDDRAYVRFRT